MSDTNQNLRKYRDLGFNTQAMAAGASQERARELHARYLEQEPKRAAKIAVIRTETLNSLKS